MKKAIHFETRIEAPRPTVWSVLLDPVTYQDWTAAFTAGSRYEGSWSQGATIRFLDGSGSGMVAVIEQNRPFEFLSIQHVGVLHHGVEDRDSAAVRQWAPAFENYTLTDDGPATRLTVDLEVLPDFEVYMVETWPKALARLRNLCEAGRSPR